MKHQDYEILLHTICQAAGCTYLSDLRQPDYRSRLPAAIRHIGFSNHEPEQWRYAISYIFDMDVSFTNEQELMQFLTDINC